MKALKVVDVIAAILLIVGGLNWGLVGLFEFNLVEFLFGGIIIDRVIYILVALGSFWQIFNIKGIQNRWK